MSEKWVPLIGYDNLYEVSNCGNIKSIRRGVIMSQVTDWNGYKRVSVNKNGKCKCLRVHREVARAFIGDVDGMFVDHINTIKTDNRVCNLDIVSPRENTSRYFSGCKTQSRFTGVYTRNGKFYSCIRFDGKTFHLVRSYDEKFCAQSYIDAVNNLISGTFIDYVSDLKEYSSSIEKKIYESEFVTNTGSR